MDVLVPSSSVMVSSGKAFRMIELNCKLNWLLFFLANHFCFKEWLTDCGYSYLENQHTFSKKWIKQAAYGNSWWYLLQINLHLLQWTWQLDRKFRNFLMRSMTMLVWFWGLYNDVCKHLEALHDSLNQYLLKEQCTKWQNHAGGKDLFKALDEWVLM